MEYYDKSYEVEVLMSDFRIEDEDYDIQKKKIKIVKSIDVSDPKVRAKLKAALIRIRQPQITKGLKQLALIGATVVLDEKIMEYLDTIFVNNRNNERKGIYEVEKELEDF